ncbi:MAG TPA: hypothetical protein VHC69_25625 [Polyangiaceae bacterium]|nr:hypothetical protein [Polyangiaceae bacterium]
MLEASGDKKWVRWTRLICAHGVLCCAFYVTACGGDSSGSGANACGISGCGGDIEGTWDVTSICVDASSLAIPSTGVAACDAVAKAASNTAKAVPMSMSIGFTDTNYTMTGTLLIQFDFVFTKDCLTAQGGSGASQGTCNALQMGLTNQGLMGTCMLSGDTCACNATKTTPVSVNETYKVEGTQLTLGTDSGPYCVMGDTARFESSNTQIGGSFSLKRAAAQTP